MAKEIIAPTTSAETTEQEIRVTDLPASIIATNLATTETVSIAFSVDNGKNWEDLYLEGLQVQLTATNKAVGLYSPMLIAVTKSATAAASGVYLSNSQGPDKL